MWFIFSGNDSKLCARIVLMHKFRKKFFSQSRKVFKIGLLCDLGGFARERSKTPNPAGNPG